MARNILSCGLIGWRRSIKWIWPFLFPPAAAAISVTPLAPLAPLAAWPWCHSFVELTRNGRLARERETRTLLAMSTATLRRCLSPSKCEIEARFDAFSSRPSRPAWLEPALTGLAFPLALL